MYKIEEWGNLFLAASLISTTGQVTQFVGDTSLYKMTRQFFSWEFKTRHSIL